MDRCIKDNGNMAKKMAMACLSILPVTSTKDSFRKAKRMEMGSNFSTTGISIKESSKKEN